MNENRFFSLMVLVGVGLVSVWGCQSSHPSAPVKFASLNVTVPVSNALRGSLLGSTSNELLFKVTGPGMSPVRGSTGAFSAPVSSGGVTLSVSVPMGPSRVLALQLNDASTHQPLAVGAAALDLSTASASDLSVELGSVTRNCYFVNEKPSGYFGGSGMSYGFSTDNLYFYGYTAGTQFDFGAESTGTGYEFVDASGNTGGPLYASSIAYMGNGDLVDFAYVPDPGVFSYSSTGSKSIQQGSLPVNTGGGVSGTDVKAALVSFDLAVGDVYCLNLSTIPGGHAWVQVTDVGVPGTYGPSFRFRTNSTLPFYGYERTSPDLGSNCSTSW